MATTHIKSGASTLLCNFAKRQCHDPHVQRLTSSATHHNVYTCFPLVPSRFASTITPAVQSSFQNKSLNGARQTDCRLIERKMNTLCKFHTANLHLYKHSHRRMQFETSCTENRPQIIPQAVFASASRTSSKMRWLTHSTKPHLKKLLISSVTPSNIGTNQTRKLSTSSLALQKPHILDPVMPQVGSPDTDIFGDPVSLPVQPFKGLETEFPCLARVKNTGPEPSYHKVTTGYKMFTSEKPFRLQYNSGVLPRLNIAYETFGELNSTKSNAVVVLAGLSASSHVRSSVDNMRPGWWERFVGPGCALDTNKFFVISPNNFGSCYGSSGPSTINELTGKPYGTTFPIISIEDMTHALFILLDYLGIDKLYAAVGSSMGGMLSLQSAASYPNRVERLVSISACAQSHPSSIAMRYLQRKCIMVDPNWNKGHYYDGEFPKVGMKLAREIATITYRSGPEWEQRFGRDWINEEDSVSLCPTFLIESYLEHQGEAFSTIYDPNSLLYLSKAMDMFDMARGYNSLEEGLARVRCPVMVVGVQTDILFPIWQQRTLAKALMDSGNDQVTFYELNSIYGHDTFLLDLNGVGAAVKGFLETEQKHSGNLSKHKVTRRKRGEQTQGCPLN